MPEITSVEAIRAKLREFEERVDGAIAAAKTLSRIKSDAEKLLSGLEESARRGKQSLQEAEEIRLQFQQLQHDWEQLNKEIEKSQTESKETRDLLLSELDSAIQSLGTKLAEAEERLKATNKGSLAEQADLLMRLDTNTQSNAQAAMNSKDLVFEQVGKLNQLLGSIRDELQSEARTKLLHAEELLDSQLKEIAQNIEEKLQSTTQTLTETATNNEVVLHEQINSFKEEMKRNLSEHEQIIDRQLTEFLNKQNVLVQNLSQQIDSFNRLSQAQSADLAATNTKFGELLSGFKAHREATTTELAALAASVSELRALLAESQTVGRSQGELVATLASSLQDTTTRLNQTLDKLKQVPLVGGKFK